MKRNGFTIVEVLIAVVVGSVIMAAIYGAMVLAQHTSANLGRKVVTQQDTRAVLDFMAMEIRMASYNPRMSASMWNSAIPTSCGTVQLVIGAVIPDRLNKGIQFANRNNILVAMDLNDDGLIGVCTCAGGCCGPPNTCAAACAGNNEFILYSYNGANTITRNVSCGPNTAILGGAAPDSNVRNQAQGIFLFRYFDRADADITTAVEGNQALISTIRRILITIVADTAQNDVNTGQPRRMIYSTNVIMRNHVLSP